MLPDGSSIAAGETRVLDDDIYLVMNDICGRAQWEYAYDFGGNERVGRIRQTGDGGFIIVGTTENRNLTPCDNFNQIFLLKVDAAGTVDWGHLYGGEGEEVGYDVQVYPDESGFIIAGETNSGGGGARDGYLIRTDASGARIWDKTYGGTGDESFRACTISNTRSEIIAVGETFTYWGPTNGDIFLVRTSASGNIMTTKHYDGDDGQDETAYSVLEDGRDIIMAGGTFSYLNSSEAFMLRTTASGTSPAIKLYGNADRWDEFRDMVKVEDSNFAVTGRFYNPPGGWTDFDMYVGLIAPSFALTSSIVHGGNGDDQGWGISTIPGSEEVIVAGLTDSYGAGLRDMYQVRQNILSGESGCNDRIPEVIVRTEEIEVLDAPIPDPDSLVQDCLVDPVRNDRQTYQNILCTTCDGGRNISSPVIGDGIHPTGELQGLAPAGSLSTAAVSEDAAAGDLKIYPNPVAAQRTLVLEHRPVQGATMTLTISDIAGRIVSSQQHSAASGRLEIGTNGWTAGTYIVQMTIGDATQTRRVTVLGN
jgi:hypothetical protein